jgi:hypothetical protein
MSRPEAGADDIAGLPGPTKAPAARGKIPAVVCSPSAVNCTPDGRRAVRSGHLARASSATWFTQNDRQMIPEFSLRIDFRNKFLPVRVIRLENVSRPGRLWRRYMDTV